MIPSIRSLIELTLITQSREKINTDRDEKNLNSLEEDSGQRKRYVRSKDEKTIELPSIPRLKRRKWIKGKEAVSRFFDELDYNNQILSSYELTLLESSNNSDQHDVA